MSGPNAEDEVYGREDRPERNIDKEYDDLVREHSRAEWRTNDTAWLAEVFDDIDRELDRLITPEHVQERLDDLKRRAAHFEQRQITDADPYFDE